MFRRIASTGLDYGTLLEGWELAIAKALVREFCRAEKTFKNHEFKDLLQEVVLHWCLKRDTYNPTGLASRPTYMRRVVRNKLIDLLAERLTQKRRTLDKADSIDGPPGRDTDSQTPREPKRGADKRSENRVRLGAFLPSALKKLTARQRRIAELKDAGFTNKEIARKLGVHRDTVQVEIGRMCKLFKDEGLHEYL